MGKRTRRFGDPTAEFRERARWSMYTTGLRDMMGDNRVAFRLWRTRDIRGADMGWTPFRVMRGVALWSALIVAGIVVGSFVVSHL